MGIVGGLLRALLPDDLAAEANLLTREAKRRLLWRLRHGVTGADRRAREAYLRTRAEPQLHIGCAGHLLPGWLNTDHYPAVPGVVHLDATRPFPFPAATFTHIYSEHMIEHITFAAATGMLAECRRVLRPGGVLRIATPDLQFLLGLCSGTLTGAQQRHVAWAAREFALPAASGVFVFDRYCRGFGHRFLYDEPTLRAALEQAGFTGAARVACGESAHEVLRGLEHTARLPEGFLQLETLVLEAQRPD